MSYSFSRTAAAWLSHGRWCRTVPRAIRHKRMASAPLVGALILLSGCATLNNATPSEENSEQIQATGSVTEQAMANDMVRVARQIFNPINTTLQFNANDNDPLLAHYISEFASAGYGIQRVSADQGAHYFTYGFSKRNATDSEAGVRLNASIGAVDLSRDYAVSGSNSVSPASAFRISGTREPVNVQDLNEGAFTVANSDYSTAIYIAALNLDEQAPPVISLITNDLVGRVAEQTTGSASLQALNSNRVEVSNLFYSDESNFSSILDKYEQIERQIVVFGNDSMVLGNTNKSLIRQWVSQRLQANDLVSLVGCSNGFTDLDIGNEGLALGRAERVTQALLEEGVPRDRILDEGCWAPVSAGDKFPSRGVVLELWREVS